MRIYRNPRITILYAIFFVIAGCNQSLTAATSTPQATITGQLQAPLPSSTTEPTIQPTISVTLTEAIPTSISTPALPPEIVLKTHCLNIASGLPAQIKISGKLILQGIIPDSASLLDLSTGVTSNYKDESGNGRPAFFSVSPNGDWLAYDLYQGHSSPDWIVVVSADGKRIKRFPWQSGISGALELVGWLDNEKLYYIHIRNTYDSTLILNPFNGKREEFIPDQLDQLPTLLNSRGSLFNNTNVLPDPLLKLLVYPQWTGDNYNIVLWDPKAKQPIAKVVDLNELGHDPLWSLDGKDFLIAAAVRMDPDTLIPVYEWFQVRREGAVRQITHFTDYFSYADIGIASRSPDGRFVAFWFNDGKNGNGEWVVLDLVSGIATNTCIHGLNVHSGGWPPIWSPNSRYFVVGNQEHDFIGPVILVDFKEGWAAQITENVKVFGWMNSLK